MSLLIIYNASGSLLGHATYAYHHIANTSGKSCSACTLTHGASLSLSESPAWRDLKARIEAGDAGKALHVKELHKEGMTDNIKAFMRRQQLDLPCVLLDRDGLEVVFAKKDLDEMNGDVAKFEEALKNKMF